MHPQRPLQATVPLVPARGERQALRAYEPMVQVVKGPGPPTLTLTILNNGRVKGDLRRLFVWIVFSSSFPDAAQLPTRGPHSHLLHTSILLGQPRLSSVA